MLNSFFNDFLSFLYNIYQKYIRIEAVGSNEVLEHPVISPISGSIYERRLIEKYIDENGKDPINGNELNKDQLVSVELSIVVKPNPPTATSIPPLRKTMGDELDTMHRCIQRQQLELARQELSHALYQRNAAFRVIGCLNKALAILLPQTGIAANVSNVPQPTAGNEAVGAAAHPTEKATELTRELANWKNVPVYIRDHIIALLRIYHPEETAGNEAEIMLNSSHL